MFKLFTEQNQIMDLMRNAKESVVNTKDVHFNKQHS